jgi:hypothetical protein
VETFSVAAIGRVASSRREPFDDDWDADAIDGTPVLDIKPYMREFGPRGEVRQPHWADEIMGGYF